MTKSNRIKILSNQITTSAIEQIEPNACPLEQIIEDVKPADRDRSGNLADLEDYFDKFDAVLDEDKERKLQQLIEYSRECNQLMSLINEILGQLGQLKSEYDSVFSKTNEVHSSCQNVMNQHVRHLTSFELKFN